MPRVGHFYLSGGGGVDHIDKVGSPGPRLLAHHHDVHAAEEEPVVVAVWPTHGVDARVPVDHVTVVTDPVQVLEDPQRGSSAAAERIAGLYTLKHKQVQGFVQSDLTTITTAVLLGVRSTNTGFPHNTIYGAQDHVTHVTASHSQIDTTSGKLTSRLVMSGLLCEAEQRTSTIKTDSETGLLVILTRLFSVTAGLTGPTITPVENSAFVTQISDGMDWRTGEEELVSAWSCNVAMPARHDSSLINSQSKQQTEYLAEKTWPGSCLVSCWLKITLDEFWPLQSSLHCDVITRRDTEGSGWVVSPHSSSTCWQLGSELKIWRYEMHQEFQIPFGLATLPSSILHPLYLELIFENPQ